MSRPGRAAVAVGLLALLAAVDGATPAQDRGAGGPFGWLAGSLRDRVLDVVDPEEIVERLDIDALLARVDIDALLARVDVDALVGRVDVDALVRRVDVDALVGRVDVDALVRRVDVDALVARVDIDALLARVDLEPLVQRAGIPDIVAESTTGLMERTLDVVRRQLLGIDVVITRATTRLLSRDVRDLPAGPAELVDDTRSLPAPGAPMDDVTGDYAGGVTRLVAFGIDWALAVGSFTIAGGALGSLLRAIGVQADGVGGGLVVSAAAVLWLFTYWWATTAIAGRTPGMAVIGLRVVTRSGMPLSGRRAFIRVVTMPLSFLLFGLGLLGIVVDRERRALHDLFAGSTVVYDWGGRRASMPTPLARWLARRTEPVPPRPLRTGDG